MRIAVIGAGISGLGSALALGEQHDVVLFEKATRIGGHANTVEIDYPAPAGESIPMSVDTGFIVYNEKTYPNLTALFDHLDVETEWSDMSLSFSIDGGRIEWAADNLDKIFAQRTNILRPGFVGAMREVLRFNREAQAALDLEDDDLEWSVSDWLDARGFGAAFRRYYLYPMAGAIWSTPTREAGAFPAGSLFRFYRNHDLFAGLGDAVQWRTVTGGSKRYVAALCSALRGEVRSGADVLSVETVPGGVEVRCAGAEPDRFDQVVLATHSDEALALQRNADAETRALLGAIRFTPNRAILHRDASLMPRRRKVWSSWNTVVGAGESPTGASVTYWMNRLQNIDPSTPLFVSLNPTRDPAPETVFREHAYAHPHFDTAAFAAQGDFDRIQGRGGIWYAGAWLGYGFHEDGLRAAMRVCNAMGARPVWARDVGEPMTSQRIAAE